MNKKLIFLIAGILLILAGLLGWSYFKNNINFDEQVLEDIKLNEDVQGTEVQENVSEKVDKTISKKPVKANVPKQSKKFLINVSEQEKIETPVTPVFEETVSEEKELTNPYVDSDGSIVVTDEFKQPIKQKVKYRGVVYSIKTKLLESQK